MNGDITIDGTEHTGHFCDSGDFDRTVCPEPCGVMHSYCSQCGKRQDSCVHHPNGQLPEQPDGIDSDSQRLPTAGKAAERVRAYVRNAGDGLYDELVGAPLYGRDLETLCRLADDAQKLVDELRPNLDGPLADPALSAAGRTAARRLAAILEGELT